MIRLAVALLTLALCVRGAGADGAADRFQAALAAADIDALERLGAEQPVTRWTDDAWSEAAHLARRAGDFARARRDLEQVIAVGTDDIMVRRARAELALIASVAGETGEWSVVAAEHERLVPALHAAGDPRPTLRALESLVTRNAAYPRRAAVMLAIAAGWEREGQGDVAIRWLREATRAANDPIVALRARAELVRTLIRQGELASAEVELAAVASTSAGVRTLVAELRASLDRAEWRRTLRWAMWGVLVLLGSFAAFALRRAAGSWAAGARRLMQPPIETLFLAPVAIVLVIVAHTGNPLVASAVRTIAIAGVGSSWISGVILATRGRVSLVRAVVHALCAMLAVACVTYIAVDDGHLIDFVIETWRGGHELG